MRNTGSVFGISRLRIGTDGQGVTTLVALHQCDLRCRYCLNPQGLSPKTAIRNFSPEELMAVLRKDELYYLATGGGVTFGGGEPLLQADFIKDVLTLIPSRWRVCMETSLNVRTEKLALIADRIDEFIVDVKDMNGNIYHSYCGRDNAIVKNNLEWLVSNGYADKVTCKLPLIQSYNSREDVYQSQRELERMGLSRFVQLEYRTNIKKQ